MKDRCFAETSPFSPRGGSIARASRLVTNYLTPARIPASAQTMRFFLTNFLVTLSAYGLITFVYPSESVVVPRICLMWAAPVLGTLAALVVTRVSLLGRAFGAEALAIYTMTGIYCVIYHQGAILDNLQYVTIAYFLPGATLALLVGVFAKRILR
jgi:hypothetical protein